MMPGDGHQADEKGLYNQQRLSVNRLSGQYCRLILQAFSAMPLHQTAHAANSWQCLWPQVYPSIFLEFNQSNNGRGDDFNLIDKRIC